MAIVFLWIRHFYLDSLAKARLVVCICQLVILVFEIQDVSVWHQSVVGSQTVGQLNAMELKVLLVVIEVIVLASLSNSSFVPLLGSFERL